MATPVRLPPIATDTTDGTLVRWLADVGDTVELGQVIAEVDTAKVLFEVEAPAAGTLIRLAAAVGQDVVVGETLAWIGQPGETPPAEDRVQDGEQAVAAAASTPTASTDRVRAAPVVRRTAERLGVDLATVPGSGPGGRILREDVELAAGQARGPASPRDRAERMRAAIAAAMSRSKREVPHFYAELEVDTSARETEIARHGFTAVLLACVARRLAADPVVNGTYDEGDGLARPEAVNLGVAVAVESGLVVPVLHGADRLTLPALVERLDDLVTKARAGRLTSAEIEGVTFTVSNAGGSGIDSIVPIVHQPAIAILGVGARALRPVVVDDAVAPRPTVRLVLSCDHRAVDGLDAARWLVGLGGELGSAG